MKETLKPQPGLSRVMGDEVDTPTWEIRLFYIVVNQASNIEIQCIAFTRETSWDKYVDIYFTIEKFKEAYALEIAPMPGKDQWVHTDRIEKIYPPIIKRPPGRPKKKKIVPRDEPKKRHRCPRCGMYGHHEKTCKNDARQGFDDASSSKRKGRKRS
ncbi:hypothetical protein LXL04_025532 [Taraxacum kok-saghyz]